MSADPVTLAIISGAISVVSGYAQVQTAKAKGKAQALEYERQKKVNALNSLQEENRRREKADEDKKNNLSIFASSGFDPSSRTFLEVNNEVDRIAAKDISNIRLNKLSTDSQLSTAGYINKVTTQSKIAGGYLSAVKGVTTAYGNYTLYKDPKSTSKFFTDDESDKY